MEGSGVKGAVLTVWGMGEDSSVFRGLGDRMYVCECVFLSVPKWERRSPGEN